MPVLERVPPFGSLLPVLCNVEEPSEVLRRVHAECQLDGGSRSRGDSGEACGDGGMDVDVEVDMDRSRGDEETVNAAAAAAFAASAAAADPFRDGSVNPCGGADGQQSRHASDGGAPFPQWVRLRNIRAASVPSKGVWIGMFNRMSRISPVPVNSDPVARIQRCVPRYNNDA